MRKSLREKWNADHKRIPINRGPSSYAVEKEKLFPRRSYICDIGGGTGSDALYFLERGHKVVIVDISDYALSVATKKAKDKGLEARLETRIFDLSSGTIPLGESLFDIVYSRLVLHQFLEKTQHKLLKSVFRILKPGGRAFITVKSPKDRKEMGYLRKTAKQIAPYVFKTETGYKVRYPINTYKNILSNGQTMNFQLKEITENLDGRKDVIKSGSKTFFLNEIIVTK